MRRLILVTVMTSCGVAGCKTMNSSELSGGPGKRSKKVYEKYTAEIPSRASIADMKFKTDSVMLTEYIDLNFRVKAGADDYSLNNEYVIAFFFKAHRREKVDVGSQKNVRPAKPFRVRRNGKGCPGEYFNCSHTLAFKARKGEVKNVTLRLPIKVLENYTTEIALYENDVEMIILEPAFTPLIYWATGGNHDDLLYHQSHRIEPTGEDRRIFKKVTKTNTHFSLTTKRSKPIKLSSKALAEKAIEGMRFEKKNIESREEIKDRYFFGVDYPTFIKLMKFDLYIEEFEKIREKQ